MRREGDSVQGWLQQQRGHWVMGECLRRPSWTLGLSAVRLGPCENNSHTRVHTKRSVELWSICVCEHGRTLNRSKCLVYSWLHYKFEFSFLQMRFFSQSSWKRDSAAFGPEWKQTRVNANHTSWKIWCRRVISSVSQTTQIKEVGAFVVRIFFSRLHLPSTGSKWRLVTANFERCPLL